MERPPIEEIKANADKYILLHRDVVSILLKYCESLEAENAELVKRLDKSVRCNCEWNKKLDEYYKEEDKSREREGK